MNKMKMNRFNSEENENAQNEQVENKSTWQKIKKPVIITAAVVTVAGAGYGLYKVGKKALKAAQKDPDFKDPEKEETK